MDFYHFSPTTPAVWNGGMDRLPDLAEITTKIRLDLNHQAALHRAIARDSPLDYQIINGTEAERKLQTVFVTPRANFKYGFPPLESTDSLREISKLRGLIDLEKVIVVTVFAEVGPSGSSHTR
jgi:fatty acid synthase subunit alpha, fungi type